MKHRKLPITAKKLTPYQPRNSWHLTPTAPKSGEAFSNIWKDAAKKEKLDQKNHSFQTRKETDYLFMEFKANLCVQCAWKQIQPSTISTWVITTTPCTKTDMTSTPQLPEPLPLLTSKEKYSNNRAPLMGIYRCTSRPDRWAQGSVWRGFLHYTQKSQYFRRTAFDVIQVPTAENSGI